VGTAGDSSVDDTDRMACGKTAGEDMLTLEFGSTVVLAEERRPRDNPPLVGMDTVVFAGLRRAGRADNMGMVDTPRVVCLPRRTREREGGRALIAWSTSPFARA
jgi:hypothetical protein